jgi:glycosyltransferase involved in cell wall biosynthesis
MISVLLPVHNATPTLEQALASLFRQTWRDFEIIAVDDASSDSSPQILDKWRARDQRLKLFSCRGSGLVDCLETGRRHVSRPLIARMDADDVSHPKRFQLQIDFLSQKPELCGVGCLVKLFPSDKLQRGWIRYEKWVNSLVGPEEIYSQRFVESPLVHPSVVLRTEVIAQAGGYRPVAWPEDHDLWLRLMEAGLRFAKVPHRLLWWRESDRRLSRTDLRYAPESFRAMKVHYLLRGPLASKKRVIIWGAGKNGRRFARLLSKAHCKIDAFIDIDQSKIGHKAYGIPIQSPEILSASNLPFILGAVAISGTRKLIRKALLDAKKVEERDFLFVQ